MINAGELVLKRWEPAWASEATAAVRESMPKLKAFLPWATDAYDVEASRSIIETSVTNWGAGTTFNYAIFTAVGDLAGGIGLMTRMGPGCSSARAGLYSPHALSPNRTTLGIGVSDKGIWGNAALRSVGLRSNNGNNHTSRSSAA